MWILQGLLVCGAILGMSRLASAETLQTQFLEYKKNLNEELRVWKVDNRQQKQELMVWKKESIKKINQSKQEQLKQIENVFKQKVENLGKSVRKKSNQFQLRSDLAMIKSIQLKREKFNLEKKILQEFHEKKNQIEVEYLQKLKNFYTEAYSQKIELLNQNKPTFFSKSIKTDKLSQKQMCQIQKFYKKQQFILDVGHTSFENLKPAKLELEHTKNALSLARQEVQVLEESLNALNVMIDQIGKTPKELKRVKQQLTSAKKSLFKTQKEYDEALQRYEFLENGFKTAKSKRKSELTCDTTAVELVSIKTPGNLNEHQRIGELY